MRKQNTLADPFNGSSRRVFLLSITQTTSTTKRPQKNGVNFKSYDASNRISILCRHTLKPSSSRCHAVIRQASQSFQSIFMTA
nr:MAG TPA: hypothetical protein [Caudoviricetes sp.]